MFNSCMSVKEFITVTYNIYSYNHICRENRIKCFNYLNNMSHMISTFNLLEFNPISVFTSKGGRRKGGKIFFSPTLFRSFNLGHMEA